MAQIENGLYDAIPNATRRFEAKIPLRRVERLKILSGASCVRANARASRADAGCGSGERASASYIGIAFSPSLAACRPTFRKYTPGWISRTINGLALARLAA